MDGRTIKDLLLSC